MSGWYLSPSLVRLRAEINAKWPNRDKSSDGSLGDSSHASRASDHNRDYKGCVHAIDIDRDGVDVNAILREVINDPRVKYIIWSRRIWDRLNGFIPRAYYGVNPHTKHIHISCRGTLQGERDTTPWFGNARPRPVPISSPTPVPTPPKGFLVTLGTAKENQIYSWVAQIGRRVDALVKDHAVFVDKLNRTGADLQKYYDSAAHHFGMLEDKINRTGAAVQELKVELEQLKTLLQQIANKP